MITFVLKTVVSGIICVGAKILMQYVRVEANICAVFQHTLHSTYICKTVLLDSF